MAEVYFLGDPHLRHRNITKYRDFSTPEEHDAVIEEGIMSVANKRNVIYLLGDVFFSEDCYAFASLMCQSYMSVYVVLGNHCTENAERMGLIRRLFAEYPNFYIHGMVSKYGTWLTHCPIHDSEMRNKKMNIHGHIHSAVIDDPRYLCVSAEQVDYKPISLMTVKGIIEERGL